MIKTIEKDEFVYVIVEPEEDSSAPYFLINMVDKLTGKTSRILQIHCNSGFTHITYIGHYIFWIENELLKWTPIYAEDIQSVELQVRLHEKKKKKKIPRG